MSDVPMSDNSSGGPRRNATLQRVARLAGVHASTAATVLNNAGGNTRVGAATRERVLEAARELDYRPNRLAQNLRRQRSMTVGLVAGSIENPFFAHLATVCERTLLSHGYELVMAMDAGLYRDDHALLETLISRGVDAVIYWNGRVTEGRKMVERGVGLPVAICGFPSPAVDSVAVDFELGAALAVRHLAEQGRRRIAYFCRSESQQMWTGELRHRGFNNAMSELGLEPRIISYESSLFGMGRAREAAEELAKSPDRPDALFCFNDIAALGAMMGLRRAGLTVPDDIALVGYDNIPMGAEFDVPLTTIDMAVPDMCDVAVGLILRRLGAEPSAEPQRVDLPPKLIVRASSGGKMDA